MKLDNCYHLEYSNYWPVLYCLFDRNVVNITMKYRSIVRIFLVITKQSFSPYLPELTKITTDMHLLKTKTNKKQKIQLANFKKFTKHFFIWKIFRFWLFNLRLSFFFHFHFLLVGDDKVTSNCSILNTSRKKYIVNLCKTFFYDLIVVMS